MPVMQNNDIHLSVQNVIKCEWDEKSWSYIDSPRTCHGFLIVLSGQVDYLFEGKNLSLFENDIIYLPHGSKYSVRMHIDEGTVSTLLINFDMVGYENFLIEPFILLHDGSGLLRNIFLKINNNFRSANRQKLLLKSDMYLLYHNILSLQNDMDADHRLIRDAKLLLAGQSGLSVDEIAERLLISSSGLRKKFKAAERISPAEYRIKARLDEAKNLLISTDLPINEIGSRCGFYDNAYFYKVFCRSAGKTPKEYRQSVNTNI